MKEKRVKRSISLKVWPFDKEDVAKLYWIDHPYVDLMGNWKIALYFKKLPDNQIKRCDVDWGTLPILRIGRLYKAGKLLFNDEQIDSNFSKYINKNQKVFHFDGQFQCKVDKYEITTLDGKKHSVTMNAFSIDVGGVSFHIPVIEVIRSILAKNRKLLYAILQPNSLDYFFLLQKDIRYPDKIIIKFSKDYPVDLLTEKHIKHLIWLCTNSNANTSWHEVYKSLILSSNNGISFPFPLIHNYDIEARFRQSGDIVRIEEIVGVKGEKIGYKEIDVESPHLHSVTNSNQSKKKIIIKTDDEDELVIEPNPTGSRKMETIVDIPIAEHEFEDKPVINKRYRGTIKKRTKVTGDTEKILIDENEKVSTGDIGANGSNIGLEYRDQEANQQKISGDIAEFILILNAMEKKYVDISIKISVGDLAEGKSFSKLDDGVTPRRYLVCEIRMKNNLPVFLIEIERQGRALSTLSLFSSVGYDNLWWDSAIDKVLEGLVNNNCIWDADIIDDLEKLGVKNDRYRHTRVRRTVWEMADKMYEKLNILFCM